MVHLRQVRLQSQGLDAVNLADLGGRRCQRRSDCPTLELFQRSKLCAEGKQGQGSGQESQDASAILMRAALMAAAVKSHRRAILLACHARRPSRRGTPAARRSHARSRARLPSRSRPSRRAASRRRTLHLCDRIGVHLGRFPSPPPSSQAGSARAPHMTGTAREALVSSAEHAVFGSSDADKCQIDFGGRRRVSASVC